MPALDLDAPWYLDAAASDSTDAGALEVLALRADSAGGRAGADFISKLLSASCPGLAAAPGIAGLALVAAAGTALAESAARAAAFAMAGAAAFRSNMLLFILAIVLDASSILSCKRLSSSLVSDDTASENFRTVCCFVLRASLVLWTEYWASLNAPASFNWAALSASPKRLPARMGLSSSIAFLVNSSASCTFPCASRMTTLDATFSV
mmetsp:Transcript_61616/g.116542  ORF Transcript_61616/g.116542 Transcript_61616/m.116542 type:complete len:208 (-) Transcript_61616:1819-2442(-)